MRRPVKICLHCNKPFFSNFLDDTQKYCSENHRKLAWKKRNRDKDNAWQRKRWKELHPLREIKKNCHFCGKEFICLKWHPYQIYCSPKCRLRQNSKTKNQKDKEINAKRIFICIICKKKYHPTYSYQQTCTSNKCRFQFWYSKARNNPEFRKKFSFRTQNRKYKIKANGGNFTLEEWEEIKKNQNYTCPKCNRKEPKIKLTRDHIIPITKEGKHIKDNIQGLCFSCNSKKSNKLWDYPE